MYQIVAALQPEFGSQAVAAYFNTLGGYVHQRGDVFGGETLPEQVSQLALAFGQIGEGLSQAHIEILVEDLGLGIEVVHLAGEIHTVADRLQKGVGRAVLLLEACHMADILEFGIHVLHKGFLLADTDGEVHQLLALDFKLVKKILLVHLGPYLYVGQGLVGGIGLLFAAVDYLLAQRAVPLGTYIYDQTAREHDYAEQDKQRGQVGTQGVGAGSR